MARTRALGADNAGYRMPVYLWLVLAVSALTIVFFPLFIVFYQYPAYTRLLHQLTTNEATAMARYLASSLLEEEQPLELGSLDPTTAQRIRRAEREARFIKLRIYSPAGVVVYSSADEEVGSRNDDAYFRRLLEERRPVAVQLAREEASLEGQHLNADLVEVYVPILRQERLVGVFEMYFDLTREAERLRRVLHTSTAVVFVMAVILLVAVLLSVSRAAGYLADRQRVLEELRTLSLSDELTGLYNRRGFFVLAEQQVKIARRAQRRLLLISADLDGLKGINDGFGHHEGDRALADAAQILRETFRESDIIGRIGGDEFLVLITDRPEVGPEILARRLREQVARHNEKLARPYPFSISAGIIPVEPGEGASLNELLVRADQAMYAEKRSRGLPQ